MDNDRHLWQISGWKFDDLDITIRQRLCEALYAAGRPKDAGESLLKTVNTFDEVVYMSEPVNKWVSGEFILHVLVCHAFQTSLQTLLNNVSRLPKSTPPHLGR